MPIKIKPKVRRPKRRVATATYRKKKRAPRANQVAFPSRSLATIPDKLYTTMTYSTMFLITASTTPVTGVFRLNSIYDPDFTGVGHQPLGHDQWNAFYNKYRVHGVKYKIYAINESTTSQADMSILFKNTSSTIGIEDTIWERGYSKHKILGIEGSGSAIKYIAGYTNPARVLGLQKNQYNIDDLTRASFGQSPSTQAYMHIIASPVDNVTVVNVRFRIQLTYYCELFDRILLNQS